MRTLFSKRRRKRMRNVQIVFAIDGDQDLVTGLGLVIADKSDVAITVLAPIGELAGQRHERRDIRRAKPAVP